MQQLLVERCGAMGIAANFELELLSNIARRLIPGSGDGVEADHNISQHPKSPVLRKSSEVVSLTSPDFWTPFSQRYCLGYGVRERRRQGGSTPQC
jgi:hypothetical protein